MAKDLEKINVEESIEEQASTQQDVLKSLLTTDQVVEKQVPMRRFNAYFTIKALDGDVIDRIEDQCTFYEGKGKKRVKKVDEQKFGALIIQRACLVPNWGARELLDMYGTHDPADVIKKRLLAGEISKLSAEIMEISGFNDDEEVIEDIKNS